MWSWRRGLDAAYTPQMRRKAIAVVATVAAFGVAGYIGESRPEEPPFDTTALVGMTTEEAEDYLDTGGPEDLFLELNVLDYSPAGRYLTSDGRGTFTIIAAEEPRYFDTYDQVTVWALRTSEKRWFARNRTMPKAPPAGEEDDLTGDGGSFEAVRDLIIYTWANPKDAEDPDYRHAYGLRTAQKAWPYPQAQDQRARLGRLINATFIDAESVNQRPETGTRLRLGQLMVIELRPDERPLDDGSNTITVPPVPNGDDDDDFDFDVPDRLCPTRFC